MKRALLTLLFFAAGSAAAGETAQIDIQIIKNGESFEFNSEQAGFNLLDLQVGENRSYVDSQGRNVLLTRTDEGFEADADGTRFDIPDPSRVHGAHSKGAIDVDTHVEVGVAEGTLIVTEKAIDEETQAKIVSILEAAGHDADVRFVDATAAPKHVIRDVRVVREETN